MQLGIEMFATDYAIRPGVGVLPAAREGSATASPSSKARAGRDLGLRVLLATTSAYEVNPSTGKTKAHGAMTGALHWGRSEPGRFQPTRGRKVAFRWQPEVSCIGRGLVE